MPPAAPKPKPNAPTHAVVMGDLIHSEDASDIAALHATFNETIAATNKFCRKQLASPLTITLGDEFQGLAHSLADGLTVIRALRHALRTFEIPCRFILGAARIETPVNTKKAWNMMGPGLAAAREQLNDKRDPNAYRFSLPGAPTLETLMDAIGLTLTDIEAGWTDRQSQIVSATMSHDGQIPELATSLSVTPRTYYKIRKAAKFDLYETQWTALQTAISALDAEYGLGK